MVGMSIDVERWGELNPSPASDAPAPTTARTQNSAVARGRIMVAKK
jgi:hypothetical protein